MKYILSIICLMQIQSITWAQDIKRGKVMVDSFLAPSIQGNLGGEEPMRRVSVYIPAGYEYGQNRYPAIYFLHGFPENDSDYIADFDLKELFDQAIARHKIRPIIIVLPNSFTHFKGSFYTNSTLTGNWADFVAKDVVQYIDKKYRTIQERQGRGISGLSMGGNGSLKLGMLYSNVFCAVYALSPGGLNWDAYFSISNPAFKKVEQEKNPENIISRFDSLDWTNFSSNIDFYAMLFDDLARTYSPNEHKPPLYADLPVHYIGDSMVVNINILKKWEENLPFYMIDSHIDALKSLTALKLDWGRNDRLTFIPTGCMQFSKKLEAYGINHFAEEYFGDHSDKLGGINGRIYCEVLPFFDAYLKFDDTSYKTFRK